MYDEYRVMCLFQYESSTVRVMFYEPQIQHYNYSIILKDNHSDLLSNKRYSTSHCDWTGLSVFLQSGSS